MNFPYFFSIRTCNFGCFISLVEASDHSDVESRVRQLRDQLEQRKREAKRLYHERKRKRRAMLLEQEETLRKELQVKND
jgi:hypothetical protein